MFVSSIESLNWACIQHLDRLDSISSYLYYFFFINTVLFSEAVLRGFSCGGVLWEYAAGLCYSFPAKVWFQ